MDPDPGTVHGIGERPVDFARRPADRRQLRLASVTTGFDYPRLLCLATLGLVRGVLERVAEDGLPGEHHFYLTFETTAEGVQISDALRSRYPQTMTIVLHHQYTDLAVDDDGLAVTLRFGGTWERLRVPFAALTAFLDPSVPFGLDFAQFAVGGSPDAGEAPEELALEPEEPAAEVDVATEPGAGESESGGHVLPFRKR